MWNKENRARYHRSQLRYESDLTDAEWAEVKPLISPAKPGGNKRTVEIRHVLNGDTEYRLPVARDSQGSATAKYGARLP
jgi:hypothetical protein